MGDSLSSLHPLLLLLMQGNDSNRSILDISTHFKPTESFFTHISPRATRTDVQRGF